MTHAPAAPALAAPRTRALPSCRRGLMLAAPWAFALAGLLAPLHGLAQLRAATPAESALDAAAFAPVERALAERFTDIDSLVVLVRGRVAYAFYRDGDPERLRNVQSVEKSALSALAGAALAQGHIGSLDQPVVALVPEWATLNPDPRAAAITVRHLLTMTAGFDQGALADSPRRHPAPWTRPLRAAPGESFAYDNSVVPLLSALLAKVTGMSVADYARAQLVAPLGMAEPRYAPILHLRTSDMARFGQLFLQKGAWDGRQLLPPDFVAAATQAQVQGGPPVNLPYGFMWWAPSGSTFMASGYGGQLVWVHPALHLVVATTSAVSPDSQRRGQAVQLVRGALFAAAQRSFQGVAR